MLQAFTVFLTVLSFTLPLSAQTVPRDSLEAERLFIRGLLQQELDAHEKAIALFQQALQYLPEQPAILSSLAESYAEKEQYEEAFQYAQRALLRDPTSAFYYRQAADLAQKAGYTTIARDLYETLIKRFHFDTEAYLQLARLYTQSRNYSKAIETYERLLAREEGGMHIYYQLLRLYEQRKDLHGIARTLERMYRLQPGNQVVLDKLIHTYAELGTPEAAIGLLEQALQEHPDDLDLLLKLSDLYRRTGAIARADSLTARFMALTDDSLEFLLQKARSLRLLGTPEAREQAIALLRSVQATHPDHPEATYLLGTTLYEQGTYAEAAPLLEKALKTHIRDLSLWQETIAAYLQIGEPEKALSIAERGLLLFPGQIPLLYLGGTAALQLYQNAKARSLLEEALTYLQEEDTPDPILLSQLWASIALLYTREKAYARADSAYEQALQWAPSAASILNNYAYSLAERGTHLDKALKMARKAVDQEPENPAYLDTLGWIYFKMRRYTEAKELLEKALQLQPEKALYYEHLGDILLKAGQREEAAEMFRKALKRAPNRASVKQKLDHLKQQ